MLHDTGMIHTWYIRDTFMMHFRYKLWQCNIFYVIFQDTSFDFQWILLMVSLVICYMYDAFMIHSWYIHDAFIRSLNENDSYSKCNIYILVLILSIQKVFIHSTIFYSFNIYRASLITHGVGVTHLLQLINRGQRRSDGILKKLPSRFQVAAIASFLRMYLFPGKVRYRTL